MTPMIQNALVISEIIQEKGVCYVAGRDAKFRPVLVFDVAKQMDMGLGK